MFDLPFLAGNLPKIVEGGWVPIAIGVVVFTLLHTWTTGRRRLAKRLVAESVPVEEYLRETRGAKVHAVDATAVFLTAHPEGIPYVARHPWLRSHITYDTIVLLTVVNATVPFVPQGEQVTTETLGEGLIRVTARYGFMEQPQLADVVRDCERAGSVELRDASYFIPDPRIERSRGRKRMSAWRRALFAFMLRNQHKLSDTLSVPTEQIVEVGIAVPV